jgi:hypothetical protein
VFALQIYNTDGSTSSQIRTPTGVEKLEQITECSVCAELYDDPRTLPCGHTFCLECLSDYALEGPEDCQVTCPLCGKQVSCSRCDLPKQSTAATIGLQCAAKTHQHEIPTHYCSDCCVVTCRDCVAESHGSHSVSTLDQAMTVFRRQMADDVAVLNDTIGKCRKLLKDVCNNRDAFCETVKRAKQEVCDLGDTLRTANADRIIQINERKLILLNELTSVNADGMNRCANVMVEIEKRIVIIDRFKRCTEMILQRGSDACIMREADTLHDGFIGLTSRSANGISRAIQDLGSMSVKLVPSDGLESDDGSFLIGKIERQLI